MRLWYLFSYFCFKCICKLFTSGRRAEWDSAQCLQLAGSHTTPGPSTALGSPKTVGHVISLSQSEASIQASWSLSTNQMPISRSRDQSRLLSRTPETKNMIHTGICHLMIKIRANDHVWLNLYSLHMDYSLHVEVWEDLRLCLSLSFIMLKIHYKYFFELKRSFSHIQSQLFPKYHEAFVVDL